MLQPGSFINVADNSGAKKVKFIKILKKHPKSPGFLGDFVIVSVRELRSKGNLKVKRKQVCLGLIFRACSKNRRLDGRLFNFFDNTVILLNKNLKPYGTRFFGPVPKELKEVKLRVSALSSDYF